MSSSKLQIWNLALSHIGSGDDVDDESEQSLEAEECRKFYPIALDMVLERHAWDFAIKTILMSELTEAAPNQWTYRYSVPADYIKALKVLPDLSNLGTTWLNEEQYLRYVESHAKQYEIEASSVDGKPTIVTNEYQAYLRYVYRNEIPGVYTPGFVMALSRLLAAFLAGGPIVKSAKQATAQFNAYEFTLANATANAANATSNRPQHLPTHLRRR